jgi:hypothetical protein
MHIDIAQVCSEEGEKSDHAKATRAISLLALNDEVSWGKGLLFVE